MEELRERFIKQVDYMFRPGNCNNEMRQAAEKMMIDAKTWSDKKLIEEYDWLFGGVEELVSGVDDILEELGII